MTPRRVTTAVAAVVGIALMAACDPGGAGGSDGLSEADVERNDRVVKEIVDGLQEPPGGFSKLTGTYRDDADAAAAVTVVIACESCPADRLIAQVVEQVWTSPITPLKSLTVTVHQPGDRRNERYRLPGDESELIQKYGERPAGGDG